MATGFRVRDISFELISCEHVIAHFASGGVNSWEVMVPLSDHEQRLLDQMERALYAEDPKFVSSMAAVPRRLRQRRRLLLGSLILVLGVGLLVLGVASQHVWLGAVGFVVMVAGGAYAFAPVGRNLQVVEGGTAPAAGNTAATPPGRRRFGRGKGPKSTSSATFMQRLEERWDKRRHEDSW